MADKAGVPKHTTYEDYDVLAGKVLVTPEEDHESRFHTSVQEDSDPVFKAKAALMEGSDTLIEGEEEAKETAQESKNEVTLSKQEKEASL